MEEGDEWLAADKLQHLLACFVIAVAVATLAGRSRHSLIRRRSSSLGSLAALLIGAGKEAGDELGLWASAGGSAKDAAADLAGVLLAAFALALVRRFRSSCARSTPDLDPGISMV